MKDDHSAPASGASRLGAGAPAAALVLMLVLLLLGTAYAVMRLRDADQWVRHTDDVRLELTRLQVTLVDAETAQRGYLATGDTVFLDPYTHALAVWRDSFDQVRALTADNAGQRQRLADLEPHIEQRIAELKAAMAARDGGTTDAALVPYVTASSRTMEAIRATLADMQREEERLDQQRTREATQRERGVFAVLLAAGLAAVLLGVKLTRDLTARLRSEERLGHLAAEKAALEARAAVEKAYLAQREFLAKAGQALVSSLDYRTTLATVARLAVPELADWCSVELLEPGAVTPLQVAVVHQDPGKVEFVRELAEQYPPDPNATTGAPQVIRSGKSELYTEIPAALLEASAKDSEHLRLIRELRLESAMVVPLTGRDRVLGALSFVYADSGRRYTKSDLAFAEDFARRAAMAIENARAHAALGDALQFQERFVAILGHDLRNPLGAIDMARGLLAQRATSANDATTIRSLSRIESSSRRMSRMVEQILDLTRTRIGGGLEIRPSSMDLCATLTEVVSELRSVHPTRTVDLRCSSLTGSWDRDRLEQVFSNLVGNAIHHGNAETPVRIEAHAEGGGVRVDVHNEGPPIPEELRANLFSPFRRGSKDSRTPKTAGLGLGLFISHEIVVAHGGKLEVQSSSGDGTTFRVTLPRITPTPPPQ